MTTPVADCVVAFENANRSVRQVPGFPVPQLVTFGDGTRVAVTAYGLALLLRYEHPALYIKVPARAIGPARRALKRAGLLTSPFGAVSPRGEEVARIAHCIPLAAEPCP